VFGFSKKKRAEEEYDVEEYDEYDDYDEYDEYDDYDDYDEAEDTEGIDEDEYDTEEEDKADPVPAYVEDESLKVIVYDRTEGPLDMDEVEDTEDYANLGSVYIKLLDGMRLRLEVEEASGVVIAATCIRKGATIQIQAFAAPRSSGIWDDIREELAESVASQGGTVEMYEGVFGVEMLTRLPAVTEDGKRGERVARFVGVDGPRWFLRGVISGEAVLDNEEAAEAIDEVFRSVIVDRGDDPRPPRELLPLAVPAEDIATADDEDEPEEQDDKSKLRPLPRRGPEITEIG
jgi:hypothetical protein